MSVSGLCQVCEAAEARHACRTCGRQVCDDHWNDDFGACAACADGFGDGPPDPDDRPDGFQID